MPRGLGKGAKLGPHCRALVLVLSIGLKELCQLEFSASEFWSVGRLKLGEIRSVACGDSLGNAGSCIPGREFLPNWPDGLTRSPRR